MRLDRLVKTTVDALEDIKGRDIVVLDVRRMTALFDKVIIVSGDSTRQTRRSPTCSGQGQGARRHRVWASKARIPENGYSSIWGRWWCT